VGSWRKKGRNCFYGGAIFEIFERQQFVRRVHVTRRDGKQTGGHPAAEKLHRVGIGAGAARGRRYLIEQ
jgi:hypothetical protein